MINQVYNSKSTLYVCLIFRESSALSLSSILQSFKVDFNFEDLSCTVHSIEICLEEEKAVEKRVRIQLR